MRVLPILALLWAASALAAPPTPEATSRKERGDARRDAGDATGALAAYREALRVSPDYVEAWEEIGKLYYVAKSFREAAEAFQRAVDIDGSYANNWFNLGLARRRAGDLGGARDAYRRYLGIKPDDAETRLKLADVLRALDDRDAAVREYQAVAAAADARTVAPALGDRAREAITELRPAGGAPAPGARVPTIVALPPAAPAAPAAPPTAEPVPVARPVIQIVPPTPQAPVLAPAPAPAPVAPPAVEPSAPPSPALLDKLALGDKLQAAGDHRGALFAYQDAVYLEPRHALARVKLGRAYWTLRYVAQADEQWQQATQLAPRDPSIALMIEEARKAPRSSPAPVDATGGGSVIVGGAGTAPGGPAVGSGPPQEGPRVYRFVPEGQGTVPHSAPAQPVQRGQGAATTPGYGLPPAQPAAPPAAEQPAYPPQGYAQAPAPPARPERQSYGEPQYPQQPYAPQAYPTAQPVYGQPVPVGTGYGQPVAAAEPPPPAVPASVTAAAQRYRAALSLYIQRDYLGAIAELDAAITLDPNLSVAYTARGSARFGLRKYREAAADYKAALDLDPTRAEPIWGLAECQRMLADPAAVDTYRRYAASIAGDVNEERRARARKWATELSSQFR